MSVNGSPNWETYIVREYLENDGEHIAIMYNDDSNGDSLAFKQYLEEWLFIYLDVENEKDNYLTAQMKMAFYQSVRFDDLVEALFIEDDENILDDDEEEEYE